MIEEGLIRLGFDLADHLPQLAAFAKRYRDRYPDLADLCLIRMSELHPKHSVITVDRDFHIYRRNKREVIPLISPPGPLKHADSTPFLVSWLPNSNPPFLIERTASLIAREHPLT
ncbi:hypothetical protein BH20VER1_BH20VER1_13530 [soil metagenome]